MENYLEVINNLRNSDLPVDTTYLRVSPIFASPLKKEELAKYEKIHADSDLEENKLIYITNKCEEEKLPLAILESFLEVSFTRSLTTDEDMEFQDIYYSRNYSEKRKLRYPPLEDFVDAYYHEQKSGDDSLMQAYLAKVEAVKLKYPDDRIIE